MSPEQRRDRILSLLHSQGYVSVSELSARHDVSEVTIRRDLRSLEEENLLFRTHGGARPSNGPVYDRPVSEKKKQHAEEKQRIGLAAADLVEPHDFIMLASGTTVLQVAAHLQEISNLTIVTSAINVATKLMRLPHVEIYLLGGMLRLTSASVVGPTAVEMLKQYSCKKLFIGVDGFDLDLGLTTSNALEAQLNKAMIESAQERILVTDSSKFGRRSFSHICPVEKIDAVITDTEAPEPFVHGLQERDISVSCV